MPQHSRLTKASYRDEIGDLLASLKLLSDTERLLITNLVGGLPPLSSELTSRTASKIDCQVQHGQGLGRVQELPFYVDK